MDKLGKRILRLQQQEDLERTQRANEKAQKRAEKQHARLQQEMQAAELPDQTGPVHAACLIHSDGYSWDYVDRTLWSHVIFHGQWSFMSTPNTQEQFLRTCKSMS